MSRNRRPVAVTTLALGLAGFTLAASGCTLTSPKTIVTPYEAADGTNGDVQLGGGSAIELRNFLMVSASQGAPGVLVGAITTDGSSPVQLQLQVEDSTGQQVLGQATVTAEPGQLTQIGPGGTTQVQVPSVPMPPGSLLTIHATSSAGGTSFALPVLAPVNEYSTYTPTTALTPTSTPSPAVLPATSSPGTPSPSTS